MGVIPDPPDLTTEAWHAFCQYTAAKCPGVSHLRRREAYELWNAGYLTSRGKLTKKSEKMFRTGRHEVVQ